MKKKLFLVMCAFAGILGASENGLSLPYSWFNETCSDFTEVRSDKWTTPAGTWRKNSSSDASVFSNATHTVHLDTRGGEIRLEPGSKSSKNGAVSVTSRMAFTVCRSGEEWDSTNSPPQAAIGMRQHPETGNLTFMGLKTTRDGSSVKFRWIDLSAPGILPVENNFYDVTIESDYSCVPTRVRYLIDGTPLADAQGNVWFSSRGGSLNPADTASLAKRATSVGFTGNGLVTALRATQSTNRVARATVVFDAISRPQAGIAPAFSVTTNDGCTLTGDLSYTWRLIDAAGMRVEPPRATGPDYVLSPADYGHWVAVDVADARGYAGTGRFWFSDLPVVEISVDNAAWPSKNKETHHGKITIRGNAEYPDQLNNMDFTLHVRGNSSAGADKKPYKIKLDKKTDLFGLGGGVKNKHWVLLANCFDESLMRNKLSYDLSGVLGCPVWMKSEWADVVMNGRYVGNYLVCQHIRVGDERIAIYEWDAGTVAEKAVAGFPGFLTADDEDAIGTLLETNCLWMTTGRFSYGGTNFLLTAVKKQGGTFDGEGNALVYWKNWNGGDASGGYVFEIDAKKMNGAESPAPSNFTQVNKTANGSLNFCIAMNTPEYLFSNESLSNFVWNTWWNLGRAWQSFDGYDANGSHYTELADLDSMTAYWLAQYLPGNDDAAAYSRYSYMDVGGKMTFGPVWDFDYGMGSLQIRTRSAATTNLDGRVTYAPIQPEKFIPGNGSSNFIGAWTADPYFTFRLYQRYWANREHLTDIVKPGGLIDRYKAKIGNSARANDLRWNNRIGFRGDSNEVGDVEILREFLRRRFAWFDKKFATAGAASTNLTETVPSKNLRYVRDGVLRPVFNGATQNPQSVETDVVDVSTPLAHEPVTATVAVPGGSTRELVVYVNGVSNGTYAVSAERAVISIPARMLRTGETNVVAFTASRADGTIRRRNFALLACALPERIAAADGGHDVETSWLANVWEAVRATQPGPVPAKPVSYDDYLAFATNASPYGKSAPLYCDYLAGTHPEEAEDVFMAHIDFDSEGKAKISWHPDTPELRVARVYTLWGAPVLSGPWAATDALAPADDFCATNRFFKVGIGLPSAE